MYEDAEKNDLSKNDEVEFQMQRNTRMKHILNIGNSSIKVVNNILQLSDAPDIVTSGDGDKYIGYEYIRGAYSGSSKYTIDEGDALFAECISKMTGDGVVLLDMACNTQLFKMIMCGNKSKDKIKNLYKCIGHLLINY